MRLVYTALAAASVALLATPAMAQNSVDPAVTDAAVYPVEDDDEFPWGLLGLLGLAGLAGRMRREERVDVNNDTTTRRP